MSNTETLGQRLIVVSNRLPLVVSQGEDGNWQVSPGAGGLVTALVPVLRDRGWVWIGWPGTTQDSDEVQAVLAQTTGDAGYRLVPVMLTAAEAHDFYLGFSNEGSTPVNRGE